jgi:hypothetical protein
MWQKNEENPCSTCHKPIFFCLNPITRKSDFGCVPDPSLYTTLLDILNVEVFLDLKKKELYEISREKSVIKI